MDRLDDDRPRWSPASSPAPAAPSAPAWTSRPSCAGERPSIPGRGFAGLVERPPVKPLIAAVEGYALAGGFEIALACDLIVAAEDATFGLPEVKRGLVAAGGGLLRLPQRVPLHLAMEWSLTGELIPAPRGAEVGLVNRLTPEGGALDGAAGAGRSDRGQRPAGGARRPSRSSVEAPDWPAAEAFDRQREINEPVRSSEDAREGATAFTEKRAPRLAGPLNPSRCQNRHFGTCGPVPEWRFRRRWLIEGDDCGRRRPAERPAQGLGPEAPVH